MVMGTNGASGVKGALFGSNALAAIKNTKCPVLAIPPDASFHGLENVTIVTDLQPFETSAPANVINAFAKEFSAHSHFVTVGTPKQEQAQLFAEVTSANDEQFAAIPHQYDLVTNVNVVDGIRDYLKNEPSDLLVIVPRKHNLIEKLFRTSVSRQLILQSETPLLVIHDA
jgi:nucleotide-binding universal stress UspA family protein